MFIHDNGKVAVFCHTRCGHTSMYDYYGIPLYEDTGFKLSQWKNTSSLRVMVLRNPLDRWLSGVRYVENVDANNDFYEKDGKFYTKQTDVLKEVLMREHTHPYELLNRNIEKTIPFKIIPFETLSDYIPVSDRTTHLNIRYTHRRHVPMSADMREAIINYRYYRQYCEVMTPEEWKRMTP
jgi:hypothetical protein